MDQRWLMASETDSARTFFADVVTIDQDSFPGVSNRAPYFHFTLIMFLLSEGETQFEHIHSAKLRPVPTVEKVSLRVLQKKRSQLITIPIPSISFSILHLGFHTYTDRDFILIKPIKPCIKHSHKGEVPAPPAL